jgi:4a-hydroxytetrahydrobiopterin dehydratase
MSNAPTRASEAEVRDALASLPGWSVENGKLHRVYQFANFMEAMHWMAAAALIAHDMDHHPEWFNVYSTVRVELVTHSAEGITGLDLNLAARLEALAQRWDKH